MDTLKQIYKGTLSTANSVLYTTPTNATTIIKEIIISNKSESQAIIDIQIDDVYFLKGKTVEANSNIIQTLTTVLPASKNIKASCNAENTMDIYISGIEIS